MTNARFAALHRLPVGPVPLSTTPVPLRKPRARHERKCYNAAKAAGFRLRFGDVRYAPAPFIIQTDGVPRRVSLGKLTLLFRRVAPRNLFGAGRPAGLVIQAIRHLRNDPDIPRHIARLKNRLDAKTKTDLKSLMPKTPVWMRPLLRQIVEK